MKKSTLALMTFSLFAALNAQAAKDQPNLLELADPDLPGSSYDYKIEMQKKVNELQDLQLQKNQTRAIKNMLLEQQQNLSSPYSHTATPVTRSLNVKFASGITPPVIRLSAGMLSTIVFSDAAGNPWQIKGVALNRSLFSDGANISTNNQSQESGADSKNNILSIEPLTPVAYGNVAVSLAGLDTPVIFMLSTGQNEVDVRIDARISGLNPDRAKKAALSSNGSISTDLDDTTLMFVDGTPPDEAEKLNATSSQIEAWLFNDELIVRTKSQIVYPAYISASASSSGVTVFRFSSDNRSVTISNGASTSTIFVEKQ